MNETEINIPETIDEAIELTYPKFLELRLYLIGSILLTGSIALPFALHLFGIAGQMFMPIYLFSLLAGLVYGFRCGLLVGLLAPIISYSLTQMPLMPILPFVVLKASMIGLISGIIIEQTKGKRLFVSSAIAVIFSLLIGNLLIYITTSQSELARADFVNGLPGIIVLLAIIPFAAGKITHYERKIFRRYSKQIKTV